MENVSLKMVEKLQETKKIKNNQCSLMEWIWLYLAIYVINLINITNTN